ncbi:MAG: coenzyme F420-0:L-glutamate ligase [Candidatus Hodarchaeales archaeon]|jgi:coenzyme F420-0:L-glutamate ligase
MKIEFLGVQTPLITPSDRDITKTIIKAISYNKIELKDKDIIIIASKIISTIEGGRILKSTVTQIRPEARELAQKTGFDPRFVEVVYQEANEVLGFVPGAILAIRNNIIQANAGVDQSNAGGEEFIIVLPKNPIITSNRIQNGIQKFLGKKIGVIIADSKTHPLRRGTSGFALATSGFIPLIDDRGSKDLYGRPMKITTRAIADNLVCGAEILMGESNQRIPIVIARGCKEIIFQNTEEHEDFNDMMKISPQLCMYMGPLWYKK